MENPKMKHSKNESKHQRLIDELIKKSKRLEAARKVFSTVRYKKAK